MLKIKAGLCLTSLLFFCSMVILLSDSSEGGVGNPQQTGSVTHPLVTQTYRCVAAYDTKDAKNRPFKVAVDEKLDVLIKDPSGKICNFLLFFPVFSFSVLFLE